jgi:hypothetical protein
MQDSIGKKSARFDAQSQYCEEVRSLNTILFLWTSDCGEILQRSRPRLDSLLLKSHSHLIGIVGKS